VSAITSTIGVARVVSLFYLGNLSDRRGRKFVSAISLSALALFSFVITLISDPYVLLVASLLNGFTITVFGTVAAYIGDHSTPEEIDRRMGMNLVSQGIGFALGPIVGGILAQSFGFHIGYFFASGLAALALVAALRSMRGGLAGPPVRQGILVGGERPCPIG